MHLNIAVDSERSEHAGASGMFQIERVIDTASQTDLTRRVDVGMHFKNSAELKKYIKEQFGSETTFEYDEQD